MIFIRPRALALIVLFASPLSAWAIDCTKASVADEKMICVTPSLMQLDAVLNKSYLSARQQVDKESLKTQQLAWLKQRQQCGEDTVCLGNSYISRIKTLANVDNISMINSASKQWDFVLSVAGCTPDSSYPTCEGPGMLDIFAKNSGKLVQHIPAENIFIELDEQGKATTNLIEMYGDNNSGLVIDDINFDGQDDIALRTGNEGAYGGPSYHIFLYHPESKTFVENTALTQLGSENLGLFGVDPKTKTLTTFTKSGCCWHQSSVWKIDNNQPVLIEEVTEAAEINTDPPTLLITTRKWVNGEWQTTEEREPVND